ncbi:MAG: hypothetical protein ABSA39_02540 [Edaphobacter sp.]
MTILRKLSLAATIGSATLSFAAGISKDTSKIIQPDNIIVCESSAACETKTIHGRIYKVINTPRLTIMVAVSHEGNYTRADVSVINHTDAPFTITPDDFRVEVVTPKPKVLAYVPPANLVLPAPPLPPAAAPAPAGQTPTAPFAHSFVAQSSAPAADARTPAPEVDDAVADKAAIEQNLEPTSIAPNQETSGRVYFERDKHAHLVNVVLPVAGLVFEFPYAMKK